MYYIGLIETLRQGMYTRMKEILPLLKDYVAEVPYTLYIAGEQTEEPLHIRVKESNVQAQLWRTDGTDYDWVDIDVDAFDTDGLAYFLDEMEDELNERTTTE